MARWRKARSTSSTSLENSGGNDLLPNLSVERCKRYFIDFNEEQEVWREQGLDRAEGTRRELSRQGTCHASLDGMAHLGALASAVCRAHLYTFSFLQSCVVGSGATETILQPWLRTYTV